MDFAELLRIGGPVVAVLAFVLIWKKNSDQKRDDENAAREVRMATQNDLLNRRIDQVQEHAIHLAIDVIQTNTKTLQENAGVMKWLASELQKRPCLLTEKEKDERQIA